MPLEKIIESCLKAQVDCIAISDHGTVEGALELQGMAPFKVIVAEEILTPHGEIGGMFLKESIPSGIPVEEAVSRVKAQGALVYLPHPFDPFRGLRLNGHRLEELAEQIDLVEVFNARSPISMGESKTRAFATRYDLAKIVGSDAHTPNEIGRTYLEMPEFNGKDEFLGAIRAGRISMHRSSLLVHVASTWVWLKYKLGQLL